MGQAGRQQADEYLRAGDVALLFHVSPKTVARWASIGKIRYVRTLGGHRRFPSSAVRDLIERLAEEDRSGVFDE